MADLFPPGARGAFGLPRSLLRISPNNPHVRRIGGMEVRQGTEGGKPELLDFYSLNWVPGLSGAHPGPRVRMMRRRERKLPFAVETRHVAAQILDRLRYFDPRSRQSVEVLRNALLETLRKGGNPLKAGQGRYTVLFAHSPETGKIVSVRLTYNFKKKNTVHHAFSEYRLTSDAYRGRGVATVMDGQWREMMKKEGAEFDFGEIRPITAEHFEKMDALREKIKDPRLEESERKGSQRELDRMQDELDHLHFFDKLGYRLVNPGQLHYFHTYGSKLEEFKKDPENTANYGTPYVLMVRALRNRKPTANTVKIHLEIAYGKDYYGAGPIGKKIIERNKPVLKDMHLVSPLEMKRAALEDYRRRKALRETVALKRAA